MMNRRGLIMTIGVVVLVIAGIIIGYFIFSPNAEASDVDKAIDKVGELREEIQEAKDEVEEIESEPVEEEIIVEDPGESLPVWMTASLVDVNTDQTYTIGQFDKPVLFEIFAVWCGKCLSQQQKVKALHKIVGDDIISIAVDTDPNEDAALVRDHAQSNGFDWRYSVAPPGFSNDLIDEFGIGIVSAPSVPMILICPDGTYEQLPSGQKSVEELQAFAATC